MNSPKFWLLFHHSKVRLENEFALQSHHLPAWPHLAPTCIFSVGPGVICLRVISLGQFGRTFPGSHWNTGGGNHSSDRSDLLTDQTPTHQNGICCGTRREFCCTSGDNHRATPCMSTGDGVACPRWPKRLLYILNRRQGCGLDLCRPNIHLVRVRRCCILLLRSSSIWFGKFLTCLCSKRVNILTCWHVCGSLGKCAADSVQCDILLQTSNQ